MNITTETIVARWTNPATRPKLWKGALISGDGTTGSPVCRCVQGDVLHQAGVTDDDLRKISQDEADKRVATLLGISVAHSVLLRHVNDKKDGCPEDVLRAPEKILGPNAATVLAFWRHLDGMSAVEWDAVGAVARAAAWDAAGDAAWDAAGDAAGDSARDAAWDAVRAVAGDAAWATHEILGGAVLRERGQPFFFLPLFGFADPEAVLRGGQP